MFTGALPSKSKERILLLDVLRGFAIFGILMVNMQLFYQPIILVQLGYVEPSTTADLISNYLIKFFFDGKFVMLFSILFGYGFYIFIHKNTPEGQHIISVFRRRIFILFLFGCLHVVLFWAGDILVVYAIFGIVLLLYRKVSDKGLLKWAAALSLSPAIFVGLLAVLIRFSFIVPEMAAEVQESIKESAALTQEFVYQANTTYATGEFEEMVSLRLREYQIMLLGVVTFYPFVLAMFLIGVWAARKEILKNVSENKNIFRKGLYWGAGIGVPASIVYIYAYSRAPVLIPDFFSFLSMLSSIIGGFFLCLCYVSAFALLAEKGKILFVGKILAPVGRMALTNYIMHSVICTTLFFSYGFGLFGKISSWQGVVIAIGIFALQIPFSTFWLRRFQYGPLEYIWRILTYRAWKKERGLNSESR